MPCFVFSIFTILVYSLFQSWFEIYSPYLLVTLIIILAFLQLILPAVDHANNPINHTGFKIFRIYKIKVIIIEIIFSFLAILFNFWLVPRTLLIALLLNIISNVIGLFIRIHSLTSQVLKRFVKFNQLYNERKRYDVLVISFSYFYIELL